MTSVDPSGHGRPDSDHATGAGLADGLLPDVAAALIAIRASGQLRRPREIRATGMLMDSGVDLPGADRRRLVAAATTGAGAWVDGAVVDEPLGSQRWLAWFPRPTGPRHAINVPSPIVARLGEQVHGVRLVRCHLAVRSWQAEALQAMANLARLDTGRRWLQRWADRGPDRVDAEARWATVVEVLGDDDGPDDARLVRGWAHGSRRGETQAELARLVGDDWPEEADRAATTLDSVAMTPGLDLRWSVGTPTVVAR
ncbi:MAG TPA: hypothetical protein VJ978_07275 [Nitriliruptoraceae bacterium]|nr:hypothetical protein [Nitriliruptoraceae bacterium]